MYIYPLNETTESSLTDKGPMTAIQSPVGDAGNFGAAVTLQDDSVLIGADGFRKFSLKPVLCTCFEVCVWMGGGVTFPLPVFLLASCTTTPML